MIGLELYKQEAHEKREAPRGPRLQGKQNPSGIGVSVSNINPPDHPEHSTFPNGKARDMNFRSLSGHRIMDCSPSSRKRSVGAELETKIARWFSFHQRTSRVSSNETGTCIFGPPVMRRRSE